MKDNLVATSTNGCFIMKQRRSLIYIAIIAVLLLLLLWSMLYSPRVQCQCNKQTSEPEEVLLQKTIVPNNSYESKHLLIEYRKGMESFDFVLTTVVCVCVTINGYVLNSPFEEICFVILTQGNDIVLNCQECPRC